MRCDGQALAGEEPYFQNLCRASIVAHGVFDPAIGGPRAPCLLAPGPSQSDGKVSGLSDGTVSGFSRARISFPVLKRGTAFFATATAAPVRGLRP